MSAIVALLHKKDEDATEAALTMLKMLTTPSTETYGIGSAETIEIRKTIDQFRNRRIDSPIIVGCAFSRVLESDRPQPLTLEDAALVLDGRIFPATERNQDAWVSKLKLPRNREESAKGLIKQAEGDFACAVAEPERLIAGRDALGVRPLYYGENNLLAALASSRRALWKIGIERVESFRPGHVALVSEKGFRFKRAGKLTFSKPKRTTMEAASRRLGTLLERAVSERVAGLRDVAIAFSGGLDSSVLAFLAKKSGARVELIHASLKDQPDVEHARTVANELKLPIHSVLRTEDDLLEILPNVLCLIEEFNPVKASIGIPFYWAAEKAAQMKLNVMLAGQGADELFAGYKRYVDHYLKRGREKVQETIFRDVVRMYESNFERDMKICKFHDVEMRLPFAACQIVRFAVDLPVELKIQPTEITLRKLVLRKLARNLGLPRSVVERPKRAVQYSTGISKALEKIAKKRHQSLKEFLEETFQGTMKDTTKNRQPTCEGPKKEVKKSQKKLVDAKSDA